MSMLELLVRLEEECGLIAIINRDGQLDLRTAFPVSADLTRAINIHQSELLRFAKKPAQVEQPQFFVTAIVVL